MRKGEKLASKGKAWYDKVRAVYSKRIISRILPFTIIK